jgi:hypothetical protein
MKRLPKISRRRIGSKPRPRDVLKASYAKAIHELMLEEDRAWARLVAKTFPEITVPKSLMEAPPEKTVSAAQIFDRQVAPRTREIMAKIFIEKQPVRTMDRRGTLHEAV